MAWLIFQELLAQWFSHQIVTESTGGDAILDLVWKCNEVFVKELLLENQLVLWDHKLIQKFCAKIIGVRGMLLENSAVGNILETAQMITVEARDLFC